MAYELEFTIFDFGVIRVPLRRNTPQEINRLEVLVEEVYGPYHPAVGLLEDGKPMIADDPPDNLIPFECSRPEVEQWTPKLEELTTQLDLCPKEIWLKALDHLHKTVMASSH